MVPGSLLLTAATSKALGTTLTMENGGFERDMWFSFTRRYNSISFIAISYLSYKNNGGRYHLIVDCVLFQLINSKVLKMHRVFTLLNSPTVVMNLRYV